MKSKTDLFPSVEHFLLIFLLFAALAPAGCEESFQPLDENDLYYFSIYGYLDASADTQWVRVSPAREQLEMQAVKPEMEVTLKNLQNGNTTVMNDSLFSQDNGVNFINFWTTTDIEHDQTYRLKAERPDGAESRVTITTPGELPTPRLQRVQNFFGEPDTYILYVDDVKYLAEVQVKWYVRIIRPGSEEEREFTFSYRNEAEKRVNGGYRALIEPAVERQKIRSQTIPSTSEGEIQVLHKQVFVASAGPEWDEDIASVDDVIYALPGGFSNVEKGLGYMVGIDSKWIPFESCYNEDNLLIPCPEEEPFW